MANQLPDPTAPQNKQGRRLTSGARFILGILAGFVLTGLLFFMLLALWSVLAGPFIRLQSASFVIVCALGVATVLGIWLCRRFSQWWGRASRR